MPETIHLLFDDQDQNFEDLQHGLVDLLSNSVGLEFRYHKVCTGHEELIDEIIDTRRKRIPTDKEIDKHEYVAEPISILSYSLRIEVMSMEEAPPHRPRITWETLFQLIPKFRAMHDIPTIDLAILLTPHGNDYNWFSSFRAQPTPDAFVQTSDWQYFLDSPSWFPIAYQIWTVILQLKGFGSLAETNKRFHREPIGCINDLCERKSDIHLKMRTADVCPDCLTIMLNNNLTREVLLAASTALEKIRRQNQYIQRIITDEEPSPLIVDRDGVLHFPAYQHLVLRLSPIEKTLYLFYLLHSDGVRLNEMSDYKQELLYLYLRIRNQEHDEARLVIKKLVDPLENSINEKISKVNAKLKSILFSADRYKNYLISRNDGRYSISLPKSFIELDAIWR
jgi:hypothetical protein